MYLLTAIRRREALPARRASAGEQRWENATIIGGKPARQSYAPFVHPDTCSTASTCTFQLLRCGLPTWLQCSVVYLACASLFRSRRLAKLAAALLETSLGPPPDPSSVRTGTVISLISITRTLISFAGTNGATGSWKAQKGRRSLEGRFLRTLPVIGQGRINLRTEITQDTAGIHSFDSRLLQFRIALQLLEGFSSSECSIWGLGERRKEGTEGRRGVLGSVRTFSTCCKYSHLCSQYNARP